MKRCVDLTHCQNFGSVGTILYFVADYYVRSFGTEPWSRVVWYTTMDFSIFFRQRCRGFAEFQWAAYSPIWSQLLALGEQETRRDKQKIRGAIRRFPLCWRWTAWSNSSSFPSVSWQRSFEVLSNSASVLCCGCFLCCGWHSWSLYAVSLVRLFSALRRFEDAEKRCDLMDLVSRPFIWLCSSIALTASLPSVPK